MDSPLLKNVLRHIKLTEEEKVQFASFWTEKTLEKGDFLLRNGEVCKYDSYIVSGALKAYFIHPDMGSEEILYFAIDDWWATDLESFHRQKPSIYSIQALRKTTLLQIHHLSFEKMLKQLPVFERYFRVILQDYLATLQRRIILHKAYDATYRYHDFLTHYPKMVDKIPQYLIASYLGISPEFLSRIRKKNSDH